MPDVFRAAPVRAELDSAQPAADLDLSDRERSPIRAELWVSFAAAASVIFVVMMGLLIVIAELRAGWVPGHELPMNRATAIHKLLFRS